MRAMRINTKKKECVNASVGQFAIFLHCTNGYNIRNELVCTRRDEMHRRSFASEGRFGIAEPEGCASICEGAENQYDDIGNHSTNSSTPNSCTPNSKLELSHVHLHLRSSPCHLAYLPFRFDSFYCTIFWSPKGGCNEIFMQNQ